MKRRDAKYCARCSLLRVLLYAAAKIKRPRKCAACERTFRPANSRDRATCGHCDALTMSSDKQVDCVFCKTRRPAPDPRVPICIACVKDPELQPRIIKNLMLSQAKRKEANECSPVS